MTKKAELLSNDPFHSFKVYQENQEDVLAYFMALMSKIPNTPESREIAEQIVDEEMNIRYKPSKLRDKKKSYFKLLHLRNIVVNMALEVIENDQGSES